MLCDVDWLMFRKVGAPDFKKKERREKKEKIRFDSFNLIQ